MILVTWCKECAGYCVCTKKPLDISVDDNEYNNIMIRVICDKFRAGDGKAHGYSGISRDEFNQCNDCVMSDCCQYAHSQEMHNDINLIRTALIEDGFDVKISCISYNPKYNDKCDNHVEKYDNLLSKVKKILHWG